MSASTALLSLRAREIARTWRLWVLPTVLVLLAATGPVIVRFTREILAAALGAEEAAAIPWADPTATDASAQWASDLTQLVVFIIVVFIIVWNVFFIVIGISHYFFDVVRNCRGIRRREWQNCRLAVFDNERNIKGFIACGSIYHLLIFLKKSGQNHPPSVLSI